MIKIAIFYGYKCDLLEIKDIRFSRLGVRLVRSKQAAHEIS